MSSPDHRTDQPDPAVASSLDESDTPTRTAIGSPPTAEAASCREGGKAPHQPAAPPLLRAGQPFGGYTVIRLLGRGGMGEVYEAEEAESGRRVALKLLNRPLSTTEERERFLREGRLAASINHPHCVYVFGTDEIQGLPVIWMEIAAGGTLKDAVRSRGQLPPREAVDAILQVVAGLEAAAATGVLHRDIKPANCFVDRGGTVKVGDFGLSTSTLARDETHLTLAGTIMGTPAFASPEQLRGEDLDVRSDIYSVGATLYYLLTGRAPFEETNVVRLVAMVLQEMPPEPGTLRHEIPTDLSTVVLRALAKRPADRFADYAALRAALEPFGSTAPIPAPPGLRIVAYLVDYVIIAMGSALFFSPLAIVQTRVMIDATPVAVGNDFSFGLLVLPTIGTALYWFLLEGLSGASLGKRVFGLRVTGARGEPARLRRVLVRTLVFVGVQFAIQTLPWLLPFPAVKSVLVRTMVRGARPGAVLSWAVPMLILFSTARRRNGWAGLHELAGATRVIGRRDREAVPVHMPATFTPITIGPSRIGPYAVVGDAAAGMGVVTGWDEKLRRPVWLHFVATEAALPALRRDLARPARLRWLAGRRSEGAAWDAYEAVEGQPFLAAVRTPQPWKAVRGWLRDLSGEIEAGLEDGSLPALDLDRLWVGTDGRIRLLDWPAPDGGPGSGSSNQPEATAVDLAQAQRFVESVARTSLAGRATGGATGAAPPSVPLPLAASAFLDNLAGARFASARNMAAEASSTALGPTAVPRGRRAVHLALSGLPPLFSLFTLWLMIFYFLPLITSGKSDVFNYMSALQELARWEKDPDGAQKRAIIAAREVDIAARFPQFLNPPAGSSPIEQAMPPEVGAIIRRIRANHPNPSAEDVRRAREVLAPVTGKGGAFAQRRDAEMVQAARERWPEAALMLWAAFAVVAFLAAAVVRGGLMLRLLGIAVVDATGREAPRWRSAARAFVAWLPIVAAVPARTSLGPQYGDWVAGPLVLLFLAGAVCALARPERGLQDRAAGTWLVPR
jgi:hypothetical protein